MIICNTRITFGTLGNDSEYQWGLLYVLCCAQANVPSRGRGVKSEVGILEFKYAINPVIDLAQDFERWDVEIHLYAFQRFVDKNIFGLIWFVTKCLIGHWLLHLRSYFSGFPLICDQWRKMRDKNQMLGIFTSSDRVQKIATGHLPNYAQELNKS